VNADPSNWVTWGAPLWFGALALLPVLAGFFAWGEHRRRQLLQRLVAARLQPALAGNLSLRKRRLQFALILGALACFFVALAQPRYGYTVEESKRKGRDLIFAVDTSRSMLATDVAPNRLERAKFAAQDLANVLEGDRLGLIAFAGSAFLQAPLTVDYTAVFSALNELDTNVIPLGGTNIAEAIRMAADAFGKGESESRALVLFTDGEDLDARALEAAQKAAGTMRIFTVGIGSPDGSLIPVPVENGGTEFIKDPNGQFVKSRLDEKKLAEIAAATGGFYTRLQNGPADMQRIAKEGLSKLKEGEIDARFSHRPIERYQWPLGLGIALLSLSLLINERRTRGAGALGALLLALTAWTPRIAQAETGVELFNRNHYEEALQKFDCDLKRQPNSPELHFNKGTALYQLGDYENAIAEFSNALSSSDPQLRGKSEYNLGTTLLKRALQKENDPKRDIDLKNAEQHLGEAIKLNQPIVEQAKRNLEIAKKELAKPKPTPPPQQDQKQDDKKDEKKDNKDQQSKDQRPKDQQSKDQQSKDQQSKDQQSKDQQSKDQQSKDQQSKDQQSKDQQSKDQQSKDQQSKDQQSKDQQSKGQQPQPSSTPSPAEGEKKLSGEIKANDSKPEEKQDGAELPVAPGEMSPNQARAVLDSLKGEDEHPFKVEQRSEAPVLKDW
jgi:Ca-activated chloride channel family protein